MKKVIAMISQDPVFRAQTEAIKNLDAMREERIKFIKKSIEDIDEKTFTNQKKHWDVIEKRLEELKLFPPEYDKEKCLLCMSIEQNIICMELKSNMNFFEMMKNFSPFKTDE